MKHTDPPLAVPSNAFLMPFNANPRAINYYNKKYMANAGDMFSFGNAGDPQVGINAVEYYSNKVKGLMFNDVFLAFEGLTKQMNNPEVMERINEKMTLLGPAVGRYTAEILNPTIIRTIGILYRHGKLPDVPDALVDNPQYEIDYVSQLAQAQRRSEMNSLVTALQMTAQMAQFAPECLDKIDPDKAVDETWSITGAPVRVLRDDKEIEEIRTARSQANAQAQQMQMMAGGAGIAKVATEADKNIAETQVASRQ